MTFVLIHSPLVGPSTWRWVAEVLRERALDVQVPSMLGFEAGGPPYWPALVEAVVSDCAERDEIALVGHSGAGPLLPAIAARLGDRVANVVFAEASIPPTDGDAVLAPPWLRDQLTAMAVDGVLPRWSDWWDEGAMEALVPDDERREVLDAELPRLPLDYFSQTVPVPDAWETDLRPSFLWFSDVYAADASEAETRGWPVSRLPGGHLHMAVDPDAVASALIAMAA